MASNSMIFRSGNQFTSYQSQTPQNARTQKISFDQALKEEKDLDVRLPRFERNGSSSGSSMEDKLEQEAESSFDESLQAMIEEQSLMNQRNQHYCVGRHNLANKFQRLVRSDWAEMYFNKIMAVRDITDDVACQNQVKEFIDLLEQQWWPEYEKF